MTDAPLTLRTMPGGARSPLFDDDAGAWNLGVTLAADHPCAFTSHRLDVGFMAGARPRLEHRPLAASAALRPTASSKASLHIAHAADRLARAIVGALTSPGDPRTLAAWGQHVGISRGALRTWCRAAGVPAQSCLDFLRVLRAVQLTGQQSRGWANALDIVDERSLLRLLDRGGVRGFRRHASPTVADFIARQHFLRNQALLYAIRSELDTFVR